MGGGLIIISVGEEHAPNVDNLLGFLYQGRALIKPEDLNGLIKLANKLGIKILVEGVEPVGVRSNLLESCNKYTQRLCSLPMINWIKHARLIKLPKHQKWSGRKRVKFQRLKMLTNKRSPSRKRSKQKQCPKMVTMGLCCTLFYKPIV